MRIITKSKLKQLTILRQYSRRHFHVAFICKSTYTINAKLTNNQVTFELHFLYCMTLKVKNLRKRNDNKGELGNIFSGVNLVNIEIIIIIVKKKIAP
jgi:hypothetical protein